MRLRRNQLRYSPIKQRHGSRTSAASTRGRPSRSEDIAPAATKRGTPETIYRDVYTRRGRCSMADSPSKTDPIFPVVSLTRLSLSPAYGAPVTYGSESETCPSVALTDRVRSEPRQNHHVHGVSGAHPSRPDGKRWSEESRNRDEDDRRHGGYQQLPDAGGVGGPDVL